MDSLHPCIERSIPTLVPIKSSLSLILHDLQVWSNTVSTAKVYTGNPKCTESDLSQSQMELDAFARRLAEKRSTPSEGQKEGDHRAKKSRQVFTYSQPPGARVVADFAREDTEVYESNGGQDSGILCRMERNLAEEMALEQLCHPGTRRAASVRRASDVSMLSGIRNSTRCTVPLSATRSTLQSESKLKTCFFSTPMNPNLFYTVSDSSLPDKQSKIWNRISSQTIPVHFISAELNNELPPRFVPLWGICPSSSWGSCDGKRARSVLINPLCRDILFKCKKIDDGLAKTIAETIHQFTDRARRGKFMSYAKFDSTFKLSEVFYEDVNSSLSGLIHEVNPDFDENQSISEALTAMKSLSSVASMCQNGWLTKMCGFSSSVVSTPSRGALKRERLEVDLSSSKTDSKPSETAEVSSDTEISDVSLAHVLTTARKLRLSKLHESLRNSFQGRTKETNLWSSSASTVCCDTAVPKRLVDVSPSSVFRAATDKLPYWHLKSGESECGVDCESKPVSDFIFKAQLYMRAKNHRRPRCFFQQPMYRVVDEGVQFPDVVLTPDRSSNVQEPQSDHQIPGKADDLSVMPNDQVDQKPLMSPSIEPSKIQDQPRSANVKVVVACDKPLCSTSEFQSVSSEPLKPSVVDVPDAGDSSMNAPASTFSGKCPFSSSDFQTASTATPCPPRKRKPVVPPLEPVAEGPPPKPGKRQGAAKPSRFCRSYRAFCDKKKIEIKYENGRYTILKEKDLKRRTIWSIISGKATHLFNSVVRRNPHVHRGCHH